MAMRVDKAAASKAPKAPKSAGPRTAGGESMDMMEEGRRYRAEDGMRTLIRAEEIRNDPGLMRDIDECRKQQMRKMASIKVEVAPKTKR